MNRLRIILCVCVFVCVFFMAGCAHFRGEKIVKDAPLYRISVNQKVGFIDRTGKIVIKPKFKKAYNFYEGLACVKIGKKYGYIDNTGKYIWEPTR